MPTYIKFALVHKTDSSGRVTTASIRKLESDMADSDLYELNPIMHSLATARLEPCRIDQFTLDVSELDNINQQLG